MQPSIQKRSFCTSFNPRRNPRPRPFLVWLKNMMTAELLSRFFRRRYTPDVSHSTGSVRGGRVEKRIERYLKATYTEEPALWCRRINKRLSGDRRSYKVGWSYHEMTNHSAIYGPEELNRADRWYLIESYHTVSFSIITNSICRLSYWYKNGVSCLIRLDERPYIKKHEQPATLRMVCIISENDYCICVSNIVSSGACFHGCPGRPSSITLVLFFEVCWRYETTVDAVGDVKAVKKVKNPSQWTRDKLMLGWGHNDLAWFSESLQIMD